MIKFKIIYLYSLLILSSLAINCSEDEIVKVNDFPVDTSDFRYPFTDGSTWEFTNTQSVSDIRPDSIRQYFTEFPITTSGTVTILYDTVINSVLTKCFLEEYNYEFGNISNRYYYINNDTALILYYSHLNGPSFGIPTNRININYSNIRYDNSKVIRSDNSVLETDSIQTVIKYPIVTGYEWNIFNAALKGDINEKYIGFENVNVPSGNISCMKLKTTYPFLITSPIYKYYSKFGLMKRKWFIDDNEHTSITNPDGDGTYDLTDETVVTSFHINSK